MIKEFKDRDTQETIKILYDFFESRGFTLEIQEKIKSDMNTYSNMCILKMNNTFILSTQGKGLTEELAKASGLAEMYERFCNKIPYIYNNFLFKQVLNKNYEKNGYYLNLNEKILSFNELPIFYQELINTTIPPNLLSDFLDKICDNKIIGIPYYNVNNDNDLIYMDPRLFSLFQTSNGMSAGNSFEEAFNQGMSEWYERYAINEFYKNPQTNYYKIDNSNILNKELKEKIISLENNNYKVTILDLSYNFYIPCLVGFFTNLNNYETHTSFSCFPVFDIALERLITELCQLQKSLFTSNYPIQESYTFNPEFSYIDLIKTCQKKYYSCPYVPEEVFIKSKLVSPSSIFIHNSQSINNKDLYEYFQILTKKLNLNLYYTNTSLSKDMISLHIISSNLLGDSEFRQEILNKIPIYLKQEYYLFWATYYDLCQNIYYNKSIETILYLFDQLQRFHDQRIELKPYFQDYFYTLNREDLIKPYIEEYPSKFIYIDLIHFKSNIEPYKNAVDINKTFYCPYIKKFFIINNFKKHNKYTKFELLNILTKMYNNISLEDINNSYNFKYILQETIIKPLQQEITSSTYTKLIEAFCNDKEVE